MKKLLVISLFFPFLCLVGFAQRQNTKAEKAIQMEQEFQQTLELVKSNHFKFELDRVYSQGGHDLSRFNPRGKVVITDSIAKGTLPFFGRAYTLPYGEGGGIEFDGTMKKQTMKVENKKKRKAIIYCFSITGTNDTYQLTFDIGGNRNCTVNLTSNNRAHISYSGKITPLQEE